jgi:hypothetical protein
MAVEAAPRACVSGEVRSVAGLASGRPALANATPVKVRGGDLVELLGVPGNPGFLRRAALGAARREEEEAHDEEEDEGESIRETSIRRSPFGSHLAYLPWQSAQTGDEPVSPWHATQLSMSNSASSACLPPSRVAQSPREWFSGRTRCATWHEAQKAAFSWHAPHAISCPFASRACWKE